MNPHDAGQLQIILPLLIIVPVLLLRARRMSRPQPLKLGRLWIRPALVLVGSAVALFVRPPGAAAALALNPLEWGALAVAALLGAVAGWYWGRTMAIEVHPENGTLMARGSMLGILVLVVLVAVKLLLKPALAVEGASLHLDAVAITDALIAFSALLFVTRSLEMFLRARRVMAASGRAAIQP